MQSLAAGVIMLARKQQLNRVTTVLETITRVIVVPRVVR